MEAEERLQPVQELGHTSKVAAGLAQVKNGSSSSLKDGPENEDGISKNVLKRKRTPPPEGMSKSAFKKLKRQQQWDAGKADRKAKKKERERSKKETRRAAIAAGEIVPTPSTKLAKEKSTQVPITFVIDCAFDELMTENEIKSLASQITRCYSDNSKARYRAHLAVSSFNGRLKHRFDVVLEKQYAAWKDIKFYEEDFVATAEMARSRMLDEKIGGLVGGALLAGPADQEQETPSANDKVVYLSSESENTIEKLDPFCTYIIGGLVDRNRHKGICYKRACDRGINTAKLPIGEFMEMSSRYVLATNHVNEIMLHWLELGNWGEAFMKVIPKRKGGTLKDNGSDETRQEVNEDDSGAKVYSLAADEAESEAESVAAEAARN